MLDVKHETQDLCLRFTNTVRWHASDQPQETLHGYADLLSWTNDQQRLSKQELEQLTLKALSEPEEATKVYQRALTLREALYRIFLANILQKQPQKEDVACLNQELSLAFAHLQISTPPNEFILRWDDKALMLERVLWSIVRSATELLTSQALLTRVGQCADDRGCGWLFLDMSKNRSRHWCDINDCGNRAKQRRHYMRERENRQKVG